MGCQCVCPKYHPEGSTALSRGGTLLSLHSSIPATDILIPTYNRSDALAVKAQALGRFAAVIHDELYEPNSLDLKPSFLLNYDLDIALPLSNGLAVAVRELPPVATAVTAVRFGGPENGHLCYSAIGTWAKTSQHRLVGPGREVFAVPPKPGYESRRRRYQQRSSSWKESS